MDPLQINDDNELNFDKSGIQLRLNRLIEKQTKRYEALISSGNQSDAQQLLQIIWQLKQLRLPGAEDISMEQSIPPGKLAPMLEPYLKNSLNDTQLSLLFEKQANSSNSSISSPSLSSLSGSPSSPSSLPSSAAPPIGPMEPSLPELLKNNKALVNSTPTQMLSPAPAIFPSIPPPNTVPKVDAPEPQPSPPLPAPPSLQSPSIVAPVAFDRNEFDEISSGEFDVVEPMTQEQIAAIPAPQITSEIERPKFMQKGSFEDEADEYDDWEANAPLRGLTTGHAPVVKKEDLENYRKEVRDAIAWEEEAEIAPVNSARQPKNYLREKAQIKPSVPINDEGDEDSLDLLNEGADFTPKRSSSNKMVLVAALVTAFLVIGGVGIFAFISMSAPKFEDLEKMGQQADKSPFEMEQMYAKAAKANPNDPRGWSGLSYWQSRQGENLPALESQAKAIKLSPKDAKQWYALALLLKTCSNYKESLRAANEAVALEPQNRQYLSLQEQVQEYNP